MKVCCGGRAAWFGVVALGLLPAIGCGQGGHVAVHPVHGAIRFRGQPAAGAIVSLAPTTPVEGVPSPKATVGKDGSFEVTTYDGNDGAPEGDYVLTVQWYRPVRQNDEVVGGPNVLPVKYASATTSDLRITVAAGENRLNPIQIR